VQIVPALAGAAARLSLFQRSPNWILPRWQRRLSGPERWLFRHAPASQAIGREFTYWVMEAAGLAVLGRSAPARALTVLARRNLRAVMDPALRARMTPNFPIGCKRILVSDDYYPAFNRPDVELVTTPITRITPRGVETSDGIERRFDALVWATGFHVADPDGLLRIVGRDGRTLADDWSAHGMQAFLGMTIAGYPNLAILLGPNSGPPASSAVHVMESQMRYVEQYVSAVLRGPDRGMLDVRAEAQDAFNAEIQRRLEPTAWNAGCSSWYLDRRGRNTTMYPGVTSDYRRLTARFRAGDYQLRTVVPPA
jgi:cation diffusion facilitator CzcD-associated flavoprotein CzcO